MVEFLKSAAGIAVGIAIYELTPWVVPKLILLAIALPLCVRCWRSGACKLPGGQKEARSRTGADHEPVGPAASHRGQTGDRRTGA